MRAVSLGKEDALSHWALGNVCMFKRDFASALDQLAAAMEINPSFAHANCQFGLALSFSGRSKEAFPYFDRAERISPKDAFGWLAWFGRGWAHLFLGQFDEAAICARKTIPGSNSIVWCYVILAVALSNSNQPKAAAQTLQELFNVKKDFSIAFVEKTAPMDDTRRAILIEALRKAGVPE